MPTLGTVATGAGTEKWAGNVVISFGEDWECKWYEMAMG